MVGPTKRPSGVSSWGALMVTCGGWPLIKDQAISLKPGSSAFGGSSREGLGIGDLCGKAELESPCSPLLCSSIWQHWALLLLELWLWQCCLTLPKLGGTHPLGLLGEMGVFSVQQGSSCAGDSSTFFPVSCGVGGAASSLVSAVAGSPEAVARMSGSSSNRAVGFSDEVTGLLSGMGVHVVSIVPGPVAPSSRVPCLGVVL